MVLRNRQSRCAKASLARVPRQPDSDATLPKEPMNPTTPAIVLDRFGGPEVLRLQALPLPRADAAHAVVRIAHAGVNFVDLYQREGRYPGLALPWRLGLEGAGEVVEAAPGGGFAVGERVAFTTGVQGAYAAHLRVPLEHLVPVPEALPLREASAAGWCSGCWRAATRSWAPCPAPPRPTGCAPWAPCR